MRTTLQERLWHFANNPAWKTVTLPVEPGSAVLEEILVEALPSGELRIAASPGILEGLAADDIVVLDPNAPSGHRLIRRGGNVCIHLYTDPASRSFTQDKLTSAIEAIGGWLDGTMGDEGLCFTIPISSGFPAIERVFTAVVGSEWYYSNVYDLETHAPLNWWAAG